MNLCPNMRNNVTALIVISKFVVSSEGSGTPLQCSCLENPRDGGAWWAAIYGVAQSRTQLKRLSSSSSIYKGSFIPLLFFQCCSFLLFLFCFVWFWWVKRTQCQRLLESRHFSPLKMLLKNIKFFFGLTGSYILQLLSYLDVLFC